MSTLIDARTTIKIGRKPTLHLPRVLIEGNAVVLRTRCGLDPHLAPGGTETSFTETYGIPTCDVCIADELSPPCQETSMAGRKRGASC
jgi:hypothetical protein